MNRYQLFMNGMNRDIAIDVEGNIFTINDDNFYIKTQKIMQYDATSGKNLLSEILSEIPHKEN